METLKRCRDAQELWRLALPDCAPPAAHQFMRWLGRFPDAFLEHAILRSGRKFANAPSVQSEAVHRYVTGCMLNLEREADCLQPAHRHPRSPKVPTTHPDPDPENCPRSL